MENLSLFGCFVKCFKNYANFKGRARRREFWGFMLFYYIIFFILYLPLLSASEADTGYDAENDNIMNLIFSILFILFYLVSLLPLLAVSVRRVHDVGRSGWFVLIGCLPVLNLWLLVEFCTDGEPFDNKYGNSPKE